MYFKTTIIIIRFNLKISFHFFKIYIIYNLMINTQSIKLLTFENNYLMLTNTIKLAALVTIIIWNIWQTYVCSIKENMTELLKRVHYHKSHVRCTTEIIRNVQYAHCTLILNVQRLQHELCIRVSCIYIIRIVFYTENTVFNLRYHIESRFLKRVVIDEIFLF